MPQMRSQQIDARVFRVRSLTPLEGRRCNLLIVNQLTNESVHVDHGDIQELIRELQAFEMKR